MVVMGSANQGLTMPTIASNTLPHNARRRRQKQRPSDRLRFRVGDVYMSAAQVRAELDRTENRMRSLKRDMARALPATDELRRQYSELYSRWYAFQREAREDWLAWGSNVSQAQAFDQEADAFRRRFVERGFSATAPTTSRTVNRGESWGSLLGKAVAGLAILGIGGAVILGRR